MLLLKATERNWGLIGPGDWEKRTWKIHTDGTYQRKTTYRPVDPDDLGGDAHGGAVRGHLAEDHGAGGDAGVVPHLEGA